MTTLHNSKIREHTRRQQFSPLKQTTVKGSIAKSISRIIPDLQQLLREPFQVLEEDTFKIDIEAAIKVLERTPHPRHELDKETMEWMKKFFNKLDSEDVSETGPTDASVNLDKYIYTSE